MNNYYIYLHLRKDSGSVFYVGKGKEDRAYIKRGRNPYWQHIVNKVGYTIELLEENLTHEQACEREIYWIEKFGRKDIGTGCLVNCTNGGEGSFGRVMSQRSIEVQRKRFTENPPRLGAKLTQEHKNKISERHLNSLKKRIPKHHAINVLQN